MNLLNRSGPNPLARTKSIAKTPQMVLEKSAQTHIFTQMIDPTTKLSRRAGLDTRNTNSDTFRSNVIDMNIYTVQKTHDVYSRIRISWICDRSLVSIVVRTGCWFGVRLFS